MSAPVILILTSEFDATLTIDRPPLELSKHGLQRLVVIFHLYGLFGHISRVGDVSTRALNRPMRCLSFLSICASIASTTKSRYSMLPPYVLQLNDIQASVSKYD